ncbi:MULTISPECIES: acyltransferase [unclassified Ruegeria]|uniref:acyltransferase family protein n=1 Tax=unclassified Ruegeria TaxID=2625375 RepID=UPI0014912724|nr:acyltransferase family protein [Ruegeria sp. HKCCD4332]NOD90942.1 acyltransferase family protein [Ruegeria sp. HKCCD4318]NOE16330.1 acyltransferase family protein [Ruegeria sp. HKCCD4318-2]NOG11804.1 acyltransferase [Ruegeria sp. HKCCD4315]
MLHSIQALRAIAASAVALYHCVIWLHQSLGVSLPNTTYIAGLGASGVHIFFVVSGFIMMWTNQDNNGDWTRFLRKRFSRVYPSYWLVACIGIPLALLTGRAIPDQATIWIGSVLLLPNGASALIDVGWTLAYEVYFYAIFAVLIALRIPLLQRVIWLSVLFLISAAIGVFWSPSSETAFGLPRLMTSALLLEFAAGALLGMMATRPRPLPAWQGAAMVVVALLGFAASLVLDYHRYPAVVLWGVPSFFLVAGVVVLERNKRGLKLFHGLSPLGDSSYALYLLHAILIPALVYMLPTSSNLNYLIFMTLVIVLFLINLAVAHLYYLKVETLLIKTSNAALTRTHAAFTRNT